MLRLPFVRTNEAHALALGIGIENPRDLTHVPQGRLVAIDIAIAFHYRPRETPLGDCAENVFVAVRCAPCYHAALAGIAQTWRTE
jgi:hypothetical protein